MMIYICLAAVLIQVGLSSVLWKMSEDETVQEVLVNNYYMNEMYMY